MKLLPQMRHARKTLLYDRVGRRLDKKRGRIEMRPKSREETPEKGMQQTRRLVATHNV
jgi:hypothetical protein